MKAIKRPRASLAGAMIRRAGRSCIPLMATFLALIYLAVAAWQATTGSSVAQAQTTSVLYFISAPEGDGFYNFDFRGYDETDNTEVDWPARFLFRQNAEIDKVKNALDGCGGDPTISPQVCNGGSAKHFIFWDAGYSLWDDDGGKKQSNSCTSGSQHIRLYANPANVSPYDRNWNSVWGYYIFGTVHKDYEGGSGGSCTTFYSAEGEEGWWVQRILDNLGSWSQQSNSYNWFNGDAGHWDLEDGYWHWTQSNGWAGYVWVP